MIGLSSKCCYNIRSSTRHLLLPTYRAARVDSLPTTDTGTYDRLDRGHAIATECSRRWHSSTREIQSSRPRELGHTDPHDIRIEAKYPSR